MKHKSIPLICIGIIFLIIGSSYYNATSKEEVSTEHRGIGRSSSEIENDYQRKSVPQNTSHEHRGLLEYVGGSDGRLYETKPCGLCGGSGIESNAYGDARVCPMCDGKSHQNY